MGLIAAAIAIWLLVGRMGIAGAMAAFAVGSCVEALWLALSVMRIYTVGAGTLVAWRSLGKIVLASALASLLILPRFWVDTLGALGIVVASALFASVYSLLIYAMKVPETTVLIDWATRTFQRRRQ